MSENDEKKFNLNINYAFHETPAREYFKLIENKIILSPVIAAATIYEKYPYAKEEWEALTLLRKEVFEGIGEMLDFGGHLIEIFGSNDLMASALTTAINHLKKKMSKNPAKMQEFVMSLGFADLCFFTTVIRASKEYKRIIPPKED